MKRTLITLLLLTGIVTGVAHADDPGQPERMFVRALELFDSAKSPAEYRESANALESIVAGGYRSGAIYYNLGNAYYRAGEFGRAILNYRKAMPYRPRDPYLTANLEQALVSAPGRLPEPPRPWWTHVFFWTDWLSFPTKVRTTFIGLSLSGILVACAVLFRRPRLYLPAATVLLASLAIGVDMTICATEVMGSRRAVITGETIARKGTDNSYEAAFDQPLKDGVEFQVLGETADWTFGHFEPIGDGWVRNEFVAR